MIKESFHKNWTVAKIPPGILGMDIMGYPNGKEITLPHDAMIEEEQIKTTANGNSTGYYPGGTYRYTKRFQAPKEWQNKTVAVEFEGSYGYTMVYLNGDFVGSNPYGYSGFFMTLDPYLLYGEENELVVLVNNSAEANSRWYSGSGLYRNVNIYVGNYQNFVMNSLRISTPEIEKEAAVVLVEGYVQNMENRTCRLLLETELLDREGKTVGTESFPLTVYGQTKAFFQQRITVEDPMLWDCENPVLYKLNCAISENGNVLDMEKQTFGIRKLNLDAKRGLRLNGKEIKLRGACIHHDNGIIGGCTLPAAEERRCRLLKDAGFNCLRMSHHPMSKAMLEACDRIGMLVMDELTDMWEHPKNINDYGQYFAEHWKEDLTRMIEKDFNHPCVILYSTGNEITEVGTPKGAEVNRKICEEIKRLDSTRYTTNAFNGLLASLDYKMTISSALRKKASSEGKGLNDIMGEEKEPWYEKELDQAIVHPVMTEKIDEFVAPLDIAGYNYLTVRHEIDRERKPNRVILGTETFPVEISELWDIVRKNAYVIGDMTWTGADYLGEAGLGQIRYPDDPEEEGLYRTAFCGDLDLLGHRRPVSYYREIVFGLRKAPYLAVVPPEHYGKKMIKSSWAFDNTVESWTWNGEEGKMVMVNAYGDGDEIELLLNGKSLGRKPVGEEKSFTASFELEYQPGILKAVLYKGGSVEGEYELETADKNVRLFLEETVQEQESNDQGLIYLTVGLCDSQGRKNLQEKRRIFVKIEGPATLQGYGSSDPLKEEGYQAESCNTYEGFVQAAIRSTGQKGTASVTFSAERCEPLVVPIVYI